MSSVIIGETKENESHLQSHGITQTEQGGKIPNYAWQKKKKFVFLNGFYSSVRFERLVAKWDITYIVWRLLFSGCYRVRLAQLLHLFLFYKGGYANKGLCTTSFLTYRSVFWEASVGV